jgi:peptide chain release factor 1
MIEKYNSLKKDLEDPSISIRTMTSINKQLKKIDEVNELFQTYKKMINDAKNSEEILANEKDNELLQMAQEELNIIKNNIPELEKNLKILLLPSDPYVDRNIIVEMRSAAGGDEASIFVADLFETYKRYAEHKG